MSDQIGYSRFEGQWEANAQIALDTIAMRPTNGRAVGGFGINDMEWSHLEELSGHPPGSYPKDPVRVYRDFQLAAGVCFIDQWIPENPLSMQEQGYGGDTERGATTGAEEIIRDGITIDSPEAVIEHMEKYVFPRLQQAPSELDAAAEKRVGELIDGEVAVQELFGVKSTGWSKRARSSA